MQAWFVSSRNPGTPAFVERGLAAVNFWVRVDVANMDAAEVRGLVALDQDLASAVRTKFANQVVRFTQIGEGDQVVTFDHRRRDVIYVGTVTRGYRYEPGRIAGHPHVVEVDWTGTVARSALPDGGSALPATPGTSVKMVYDRAIEPSASLTMVPPPGVPAGTGRRAPTVPTSLRLRDDFTWDPPAGPHRYRLTQTFGGPGPPERPFVVVMLNPGKIHLDGFRRSTTCHHVRAWGLAHGFDGAEYLNLFTIVETASDGLRRHRAFDLVGPRADLVIADVVAGATGPIIAGWGNLPAGMDADLYHRRVDEVRRLLGEKPLFCLGRTQRGYPKHGRLWAPDDLLEAL